MLAILTQIRPHIRKPPAAPNRAMPGNSRPETVNKTLNETVNSVLAFPRRILYLPPSHRPSRYAAPGNRLSQRPSWGGSETALRAR